MAFFQAVDRCKRVAVDLEVLGLSIDSDVLLGVRFNVHLRADDAVEDFISSLHEFRFVFGHGTGAGRNGRMDLFLRQRPGFFPERRPSQSTPGAGRT